MKVTYAAVLKKARSLNLRLDTTLKQESEGRYYMVAAGSSNWVASQPGKTLEELMDELNSM